MSRTYIPATYYQEVLRFLHIDPKALDSGYCETLRLEAWGAAGRSSGSQTEAILHLLSQPVHEELCHNCYGHRDIDLGCRTQSQPLQAQQSLLRFVGGKRLARWRAAAPTAKSVKKLRSNKYSNKIPNAYERWPDLFPQARGQLHWGQVR